jgi:hypothetical protein
MPNFQPLLVCDHEDTPSALQKTAGRFDFAEFEKDDFGFNPEQTLDSLVFELLKKPTALAAHLQRIYFCYHRDLTEQLYAALVDFLIVLEGKGHSLAVRMVKGARAKLAPERYAILEQGLTLAGEELRLLPGNIYAFFTRGLIGTPLVIEKAQTSEHPAQDPLETARDFIAYSQLDAAMDTLEEALLQAMERQELHDDLLELYKVTQSFERFEKMYEALSAKTTTIPADWEELKGFFNG